MLVFLSTWVGGWSVGDTVYLTINNSIILQGNVHFNLNKFHFFYNKHPRCWNLTEHQYNALLLLNKLKQITTIYQDYDCLKITTCGVSVSSSSPSDIDESSSESWYVEQQSFISCSCMSISLSENQFVQTKDIEINRWNTLEPDSDGALYFYEWLL